MEIARLLLCLLVTVAVEGIIMLILRRNWQWVYYSLLCNLLTNPALNALLMLWAYFVGARGYYVFTAVLEVAVVIGEALIYMSLGKTGFWRALLLSLLLNACSYCAGLALFALL